MAEWKLECSRQPNGGGRRYMWDENQLLQQQSQMDCCDLLSSQDCRNQWLTLCHWPDLCLWWSWEQLAAEMKVGSLLLIRQCTCFYYMGWTMYFTLLQQLTNNFILCSFWPLNNKFYLLLMQPTSMVAANLFLCHMSNLVGLTSCSIKKIFVMIFPFPQLV